MVSIFALNSEASAAQIDELTTKQNVQELRLEIWREIAELKSDLLKWVIGLFITQVRLFAALGS